ncbi:hypothetical protein [Fibrella aquatilis]|uniref:Uncharacterized protein n=1 Tax=Fibrella aquatilis TaxID=2817059 RepID=A0A939G9R1_9BACT|nr:hypothetical protein [Fibrella aquatilis]MBO0933823.1 hypothetical protein [Fibrella aquatilis]
MMTWPLYLLCRLTHQAYVPFRKVLIDPSDEAALLSYQQAYKLRAGMEVSLDYLRHARVTLCYAGNKCVAGYVLNVPEWTTLRYLSIFPPDLAHHLLAERDMPEQSLIELTCLWKHSKLSPMLSAVYFLSSIWDAWQVGRRLGKRYLLGGAVEASVRQFQRRLLSTDLFIGFLPGQQVITKANQLVAVYAGRVSQIPTRGTWVVLNRFIWRFGYALPGKRRPVLSRNMATS